MQKIDDLKEIFTAIHDLGVAWQNELVALRTENSRLIAENKKLIDKNKTLAANYDKLSESYEQLVGENAKLHTDLNLAEKLHRDILAELNKQNSDDFQNFVKVYLKKIRECVDGAVAVGNVKSTFKDTEILAESHEENSNSEVPPDFD